MAETASTEQVVRNKIKLFTFFYKTEIGVIACGDIGDISSVFTSGRYDQTAKATYLGRQIKRRSTYFYISCGLDLSSYSLNDDERPVASNVRFFLFKHITNCLPQKHLGLSRGLTIIH